MKNTLKNILILSLAALCLYMAVKGCIGDNKPDLLGMLKPNIPLLHMQESLHDKPSALFFGTVQYDTVYQVVYEDPPPTAEISGGQISPSGDISFEVAHQDTFTMMQWGTGGYYGTGHIVALPSGGISIHYPRVALQPIVSGGISQNGIGVSLEAIHFNNILGSGMALHAPVVLLESPYGALESISEALDSLSIGIGVSGDIPETNLRLGGAWVFETSDLKKQELSIFVHANLLEW